MADRDPVFAVEGDSVGRLRKGASDDVAGRFAVDEDPATGVAQSTSAVLLGAYQVAEYRVIRRQQADPDTSPSLPEMRLRGSGLLPPTVLAEVSSW